MDLADPYGGGYWATRDRWSDRRAQEADTAYKLALIAQGEREAQEAARLAPHEAQKRANELEKQGLLMRQDRVKTEQAEREYVAQRVGPILSAYRRGEMSELAFRAMMEREVQAAPFAMSDEDRQMLLAAGPNEWGMVLDQATSMKDQSAPPPAPISIYQGDRVVQRQWDKRAQDYKNVGEGPRFNPKGGVNVTLNTKDQLAAINTLRDDRTKEMAPLFGLKDAITRIRAYAAQPDALNSQQLQAELANLANTKVRAQAELNKYGNFGDLPTRFFGSISKLATGKYTQAQLADALALADLLEREVLAPSMHSIDDYYGRVADFGGVPADLVGRGMNAEGSQSPEAPQRPRKPLSAFGK